jgi:hypothetical protein
MMKSNVGSIERVVRIGAGVVLIGLAATGTVGWWGYLGVVPLLTGLVGWCPPYALLGINTCSVKKAD